MLEQATVTTEELLKMILSLQEELKVTQEQLQDYKQKTEELEKEERNSISDNMSRASTNVSESESEKTNKEISIKDLKNDLAVNSQNPKNKIKKEIELTMNSQNPKKNVSVDKNEEKILEYIAPKTYKRIYDLLFEQKYIGDVNLEYMNHLTYEIDELRKNLKSGETNETSKLKKEIEKLESLKKDLLEELKSRFNSILFRLNSKGFSKEYIDMSFDEAVFTLRAVGLISPDAEINLFDKLSTEHKRKMFMKGYLSKNLYDHHIATDGEYKKILKDVHNFRRDSSSNKPTFDDLLDYYYYHSDSNNISDYQKFCLLCAVMNKDPKLLELVNKESEPHIRGRKTELFLGYAGKYVSEVIRDGGLGGLFAAVTKALSATLTSCVSTSLSSAGLLSTVLPFAGAALVAGIVVYLVNRFVIKQFLEKLKTNGEINIKNAEMCKCSKPYSKYGERSSKFNTINELNAQENLLFTSKLTQSITD